MHFPEAERNKRRLKLSLRSLTAFPVWMQRWPRFLLAVLKSLLSETALSHATEKRDGGRFPEGVSWSQLRDMDLPGDKAQTVQVQNYI